jgi:hypothetical protein
MLQARQAVRARKQNGADFVKVYTLLRRDVFFAIVDEAKLQHLPTVGHVPFVNARDAQIHLVIRTHGPASADPSILNQQLTSFGGGCMVNMCANIQAARFLQ